VIVKIFGCSFVFGSELTDAVCDANNLQPSQLTWPALLAQNVKLDYTCHARPGSGNLQILEQILNQAAIPDTAIFVISWTWIDRFDYCQSSTGRHNWKTIMPVDEDHNAQVYYRDLHSEYRDKFTNLTYIKLAIDTLTQKQIPFVMTYMDELLFDQRWNTSAAVTDLQQYTYPYMTKFDGMTFLDWSRKHGYPETSNWHPLEQAHAAAADLIKSYNLV
jgi:hypothetical protein